MYLKRRGRMPISGQLITSLKRGKEMKLEVKAVLTVAA